MKKRTINSCPIFPQEILSMNTITEKELVDSAINGAVEHIKVVKNMNGGKGFNLFVTLTWKKTEGDLLLITQQKKPRTWVSADRMLEHIETNYRGIHEIFIFLKGTNDEPTTEPIRNASKPSAKPKPAKTKK